MDGGGPTLPLTVLYGGRRLLALINHRSFGSEARFGLAADTATSFTLGWDTCMFRNFVWVLGSSMDGRWCPVRARSRRKFLDASPSPMRCGLKWNGHCTDLTGITGSG